MNEIKRLKELLLLAAEKLEYWNGYAVTCQHSECGDKCRKVEALIAEMRKEAKK